MGRILEEISEREARFIASQKVFFVATAALSGDHRVSVSPKAPGTSVTVIDPHTVAYADLTGSGAETAAHVLENGRMTLMFVNLEAGPPKILRLFGTAEVVLAENVPPQLRDTFPEEITSSPGFRAVYKLHVDRISASCGYSMPVMHFEKYRQTLREYTEKEGIEGMQQYMTKKNSFSIDGLPSLAQKRRNAPRVEPLLEEGYVHGKVVNDGDKHTSRDATTAVAKAKKRSTSFRIGAGKAYGCSLPLAGAALFIAGMAFGSFLTSHLHDSVADEL